MKEMGDNGFASSFSRLQHAIVAGQPKYDPHRSEQLSQARSASAGRETPNGFHVVEHAEQ